MLCSFLCTWQQRDIILTCKCIYKCVHVSMFLSEGEHVLEFLPNLPHDLLLLPSISAALADIGILSSEVKE